MIKTSSKKAGAGIFGSVLGAGSGICTRCSTVGFPIASSFGILGITYFSMINKITSGCKISPKHNAHKHIQ